jgi:hypothetical protein
MTVDSSPEPPLPKQLVCFGRFITESQHLNLSAANVGFFGILFRVGGLLKHVSAVTEECEPILDFSRATIPEFGRRKE